MATGNDSGQLISRQIMRLAAAISADNMEAIAEGYIGIPNETIKNLQYDNKGKAHAFNKEAIRYWAKKNPENQVQVNVLLLFNWVNLNMNIKNI